MVCPGGSMIRPRRDQAPAAWAPAWNVPTSEDAFWYFRQFEPIKRIGHSIYVYHLSADDVAGAAPLFMARDQDSEAEPDDSARSRVIAAGLRQT